MVQGFSTNIGKLEILYGSPDFDQKVDSFEAPSKDFNYLSKFSQSYKLEKKQRPKWIINIKINDFDPCICFNVIFCKLWNNFGNSE